MKEEALKLADELQDLYKYSIDDVGNRSANMIRKLVEENEKLKQLFNNCNVSDFTPPQKAIIREGFEKIWQELWDRTPFPEQSEIIDNALYEVTKDKK